MGGETPRSTLVALDPSSTALGWAVLLGAVVADAGVERPRKGDPGVGVVPAWVGRETEAILRRHAPDRVLVEVPSSRDYRGFGYGLAKYGMAAGICWHAAVVVSGERVTVVLPETWTGSRSKATRRRIALKAFPRLAEMRDPGSDISDAIAMGLWRISIGSEKCK